MPPHLYIPCMFIHPHMFIHPPYALILFYASVCFWRLCMLWGVVMGSPCVVTPSLTSPLFGGASPLTSPTLSSWFPVHQYVSGISVCYVGISLLSGRVWVCFPISWGVGASALDVHMLILIPFFVVHYVSCFDYGSDYYSSSYSGIFWPVFCVISDSGSFPDRVSSKLGSAWHGSTTTLDAERLWRCSWLSFCATAATSIFNAPFSLCQLCYGFSTGRFLFQS